MCGHHIVIVNAAACVHAGTAQSSTCASAARSAARDVPPAPAMPARASAMRCASAHSAVSCATPISVTCPRPRCVPWPQAAGAPARSAAPGVLPLAPGICRGRRRSCGAGRLMKAATSRAASARDGDRSGNKRIGCGCARRGRGIGRQAFVGARAGALHSSPVAFTACRQSARTRACGHDFARFKAAAAFMMRVCKSRCQPVRHVSAADAALRACAHWRTRDVSRHPPPAGWSMLGTR
jgi:hypothetical protein